MPISPHAAAASFAILLFAPVLAAAEPRVLSEREAVELAVPLDVAAAVQRLDAAAKERKAETRNNLFLPSLSVSGVGRESFSDSDSSFSGTGSGIVRVSSALSLSAAALQAARTTVLEAEAADALARSALEAAEKETRKAYYKLVLLREQRDAAAAAAEVARGGYERSAEEYRSGLVSERTRRQAEVAYRTEAIALARREADYEAARSAFAARIGLPADQWTVGGDLDFEPIDPAAFPPDADRTASRADLLQARAAVSAQESRVREARLVRTVPSLSLAAQIDLTKTGSAAPAPTAQVSLTLSSPNLSAFLPFSADSVSLESSRLSLEKLRLQAEKTAADAVLQAESLRRALAVSAAAVASLEAARALAAEVVVLTREAYDVGAASYQDVRTAEKDADAARASVLSERYAYISTLIDLEYATGRTLRPAKEPL